MYSIQKFKPIAQDRVIDARLKRFPANASVATQSSLHPHIFIDTMLFCLAANLLPTTSRSIFNDRYDRYGTPNLLADASLISSADLTWWFLKGLQNLEKEIVPIALRHLQFYPRLKIQPCGKIYIFQYILQHAH